MNNCFKICITMIGQEVKIAIQNDRNSQLNRGKWRT